MNNKELNFNMFECMQEVDKIDIVKALAWLDSISCVYLCVKHDKDDTREHYHIYVKFNNRANRTLSDISKNMGVSPEFIQKIKSWNNALAYAFHLGNTINDGEKFRYDSSCVVKRCGVDIDSIFTKNDSIQNSKIIEDLFYSYGDLKISKKKLFSHPAMNSKVFYENQSIYNSCLKFRQLKINKRDLKVIYINGSSGSGKTTLAKYIAECQGYDYFVSGSGKDPLDSYDMEECIIFDDLRGDTFTKAELFKLLDNNTNSLVKSRYCNKDISNCKLIIITSVKPPHDLYNWYEDSQSETFTQLARRLSYNYLYVEKNNICSFDLSNIDFDNLIGPKLIGVSKLSMNEVFNVIAPDRFNNKNYNALDLLDSSIDFANSKIDYPF